MTPSVNYFNFDYLSDSRPDNIDSIIAGRYEILVADGSYGSSYVSKYNDYYAWDPSMKFYVYLNFNDPYYECAGQGPLNEFVAPRMAADGQDSTTMYWHSYDRTTTDFGEYQPYSESEFGSRLLTYNGTRALVNNTNLNFIHHFVDYADLVSSRHSGRNYEVAGLWFDNMSIPQTVGVNKNTANRHAYEAALGGPTSQYGGWVVSEWQHAFRDTVLIKYMAILGDSLENRLGLEVCINALGWGYGDADIYAAGYQPRYFQGSLVEPVHREFEYGISPHDHNEAILYPGPDNSDTEIEPNDVASSYSPVTIYSGQVDCSQHNVENWFNPGHGYLEYEFSEYYYDCLALYYLIRSRTTYLSFANEPDYRLSVINHIDGSGPCVAAGYENDSCYWIDALGVRLGRDGNSSAWDSDVVDWYAASVACDDCAITAGQGKDDDSQNWVVFRRRWTGDDGYQYMVLLRPAGQEQEQFAGSHSPSFALLDGPWQKLDADGNWGSAQSSESLENGRSGIYRTAGGDDCQSAPSVPVPDSPSDGAEVGSDQPSLCVTNSTPANGCEGDHTYDFEIYSDASLQTLVASMASVAEGIVTTCAAPASPLATGRFYWWRARCSNGQYTSGWSAVRSFQTPNTAPPAPEPTSPADGSETEDTTPTLTIGAVTDPDGNSVDYRFEVSTQSNFSSLAASGATSSTSWAVSSSLSYDTYYWRARARDGIDSSDYGSAWSFTVAAESDCSPPPGLPGLDSPADSSAAGTTSPTLCVTNATPAPECPELHTYQFRVFTDPEMTDQTGGTLSAAEGASTTCATVSPSLPTGRYYWWQARAYNGTSYSDWAGPFALHTPNSAPDSPSPSSPSDGAEFTSGQPLLECATADDADGTDPQYIFQVAEDAGFASIAAEGMSDSTQWQVSPALFHSGTYHWRTCAWDGIDSSAFSASRSFGVDLESNSPPTAPDPYLPFDGATIIDTPIVLTVDNATDPDGDPLEYDFYVYTDEELTQLEASQMNVPSDWSQTEAVFFSGETPVSNQIYYWCVRAHDAQGNGPMSETFWFRYFSLTTGVEDALRDRVPRNGAIVPTMRPTLSVRGEAFGGGSAFLFDVAHDSSFVQGVASSRSTRTDASGVASWQVPNELAPDQTYYWRVAPEGGDYGEIWSFEVTTHIYASPNPVSFVAGEVVTFHLPDERGELLIQTVSGQTVRLESALIGEWEWDGANSSGQQVAPGVYFWYHQPSGAKGKIVVRP